MEPDYLRFIQVEADDDWWAFEDDTMLVWGEVTIQNTTNLSDSLRVRTPPEGMPVDTLFS